MSLLPQRHADAPPQFTQSKPRVLAGVRRIVLLGFMGAGKSTVGRLLAESLGWAFLDLDAHLESREGSSIPALFTTHGESHFRRLESLALVSALAQHNVVLALGGGTPEVLTNRLLLEQTPGTLAIFLQADFGTLYDRCLLQGLDRPLLADLTQARLRFDARQPAYRRLARHTVPTAGLTPVETATHLTQLLENLATSPRKPQSLHHTTWTQNDRRKP